MSIKKQPLANAVYIHKLNKIKVLHLIREAGEISRAEIVKQTGLSSPTVTRISDGLINNERLVSMVGMGESSGGRPPKILRFNSKNNYVVGIDLGTTFIRGAISNLDGEFLMEREVPTRQDRDFNEVMKQIADLINTLISRELAKEKNVLGVGLAIAGLINKNSGIIEYSPVFNWKNVNVKEELSKYIDWPVVYGNVSKLTALGELWYGIGKEYNNFIAINLGYGIGAGIIVDGKTFNGADGYAGEFGHIVLDLDSKAISSEGVYGTLESLASGYGIVQIVKDEIKKGRKSELSVLVNGDLESLNAKLVFEAAMKGDALSLEVFQRAVDYLGVGIDSLIKLFNPECIVLSGGLTKSGEFLLKNLKTAVKKHRIGDLSREVDIKISGFGENAALMGAFSLILTKVLNLEISSPDSQ